MATAQLEELERWMNDPDNNLADQLFGYSKEELLSLYEEQYNKVLELTLEAEERMEQIQEDTLDAYEHSADRQEELLKRYEKVQDELERTSKRVALWQGEDAYGKQADISKQMAATYEQQAKQEAKLLKNWEKQLAVQKEIDKANQPALIAAREQEVNRLTEELNKQQPGTQDYANTNTALQLAKIALQEAQDGITETQKFLDEKVEESKEHIKDLQDEAAEALKDAYENSIDEIQAQMTEKLWGDRNLDNLTNDWEWDQDYFTTYKDTVEKTYETEKLRLKYMDLLDDAQGMSLNIQRQIKNAMDEQLALLDNQTTLSQYDVDLANARLEVLQKQIALENAQQNKNQMKLRRDTQGNYKYVYTADQEDVKDKEAELLDSEFDAYEMSKEANRNAFDNAISIYNQYIEQRNDLAKRYYNDEDKLEEELAKLNENYLRAMEANKEDLEDSYNGMILSVEWMAKSNVENVAAMADDVLENLKEHNQEALEEIGIPWNDAMNNAIEDFDEIKDQARTTSQDMINQAKEFTDHLTGPEGIGAITQEQYGQAEEAIDAAKDATDELTESTNQLNEALTQELGATSAAEKKIAEYKAQLEDTKNSQSAIVEELSHTQTSLAQAEAERTHYKTEFERASARTAEEERLFNGNFKRGDVVTLKKNTIVYYGRGGKQSAKDGTYYKLPRDTSVKIGGTEDKTESGSLAKYPIHFYATGGQGYPKLHSDRDGTPKTRQDEYWHLDKDSIKANMVFDTGGFTGSWAEDGIDNKGGKLAVLHSKELVLNSSDTQNILTAVDIVRKMTEGIKLFATNSSLQGLSRINKQIQGDTIEQRVEITAEFPNANSAEEIKQALLGLADSAMQYSYREKNFIG